jgi:hypothetical protein
VWERRYETAAAELAELRRHDPGTAQIWVGADTWPAEAELRRQTWIEHHPDWEHRLWTRTGCRRA